MGTYNTTEVSLVCPRCGVESRLEVGLYFGFTSEMRSLKLGDLYPFHPLRAPQNGGPVDEGAAYAVCPLCDRDYHCVAFIRDGRLDEIRPDMEEMPYTADKEQVGTVPCPACGGLETRLRSFDGFEMDQLLCDSETCHHMSLLIGDSAN